LIETNDPDLICSGILHDICKLDCTRLNERTGRMMSPGHDKAAGRLIRQHKTIQKWIEFMGGDIDNVAMICEQHMRFHQFGKMKDSKQQAMKDLPVWNKLVFMGSADNMLKEFDVLNPMASVKW
jgi:hypothetical protein